MRILTGAAIAAMTALTFQPLAAEELTGTLKKIKDAGAIVIGYRETSIPFSYLDGDQKPIGYTLDICARVVDAIKTHLKLERLEVKLNPVTSASRIPLLANGTIDLECGSTTNTIERHSQVDFTNTDFLTATRTVSKKDRQIRTINDLKGLTVASVSGTINLKEVFDANAARKLGLNIVSVKDHSDAFLMIETGRADAFAMDDVLLASLVAAAKAPADYAIASEALSRPEPYAIMLRKNDAPFKAVVDAATKALYESPDGPALYTKWFETPIPPRGINLKLPMSEALRAAFVKPSDSPDPSAY